MEVIYTGLRQTPEMIAEAALQEDVDAVGLSILSGGTRGRSTARFLELLKANGQTDGVKLFLGGIIPEDANPSLIEMGVIGVYGPGTLSDEIYSRHSPVHIRCTGCRWIGGYDQPGKFRPAGQPAVAFHAC